MALPRAFFIKSKVVNSFGFVTHRLFSVGVFVWSVV